MLIRFLLTNTDGYKLLVLVQSVYGERDISVENTFGDSDDGSLENLPARKVALFVSKSITSLSSYAGTL